MFHNPQLLPFVKLPSNTEFCTLLSLFRVRLVCCISLSDPLNWYWCKTKCCNVIGFHITYLTSFFFSFLLIFFWSYVIVFVPFFVFFTSIHSVALMTQLNQDVWLVFFIFLCTQYLTLRFCHVLRLVLLRPWNHGGGYTGFCLNREEESPIKSDLDAFSYLPRHMQKVIAFSMRSDFVF